MKTLTDFKKYAEIFALTIDWNVFKKEYSVVKNGEELLIDDDLFKKVEKYFLLLSLFQVLKSKDMLFVLINREFFMTEELYGDYLAILVNIAYLLESERDDITDNNLDKETKIIIFGILNYLCDKFGIGLKVSCQVLDMLMWVCLKVKEMIIEIDGEV
jgi:hypothetical protein